jgi:hypothetical protein
MFVNALAAYNLYNALLKDIRRIRPRSELVYRQDSVVCIERESDRTVIHFIISRDHFTVTVYCAKPKHPYVSVIRPSAGHGSAQFTGRLTYVNKLTGNVVVTAYAVGRAWWLHGLPRNIEGGFAQAV